MTGAPSGGPGRLLSVEGVSRRFGGLVALDDVTFTVDRGEVVGLIGPNGAGKSTLFSVIGGAVRPTSGAVHFGEHGDICGRRPSEICQMGLVRTFQLVRPLQALTVLENVMVGAYCRVRRRSSARELAYEALETAGLAGKADVLADALTTADRKRLEVARAVATQPELLLLDEVMSGLTPAETADAIKLLETLRERGVTMIITEHVMQVIMAVSGRIVVLDHGVVIARGAPEEVVNDPAVIAAYLGEPSANGR